MDGQKMDDKARFWDLSDKADRLERHYQQAVKRNRHDAADVFCTALMRTLDDLAEIVERAARGDR